MADGRARLFSRNRHGWIAQPAEHPNHNRTVGSSSLPPAILPFWRVSLTGKAPHSKCGGVRAFGVRVPDSPPSGTRVWAKGSPSGTVERLQHPPSDPAMDTLHTASAINDLIERLRTTGEDVSVTRAFDNSGTYVRSGEVSGFIPNSAKHEGPGCTTSADVAFLLRSRGLPVEPEEESVPWMYRFAILFAEAFFLG